MILYKDMAINAIMQRDDIQGWIDDLTDTGQHELAEDLIALRMGVVMNNERLYRLAWYLNHVESVGNG